MTTPHIAQKASYPIDVVEGKNYAWCACGRSNTQPFCDGSHKGSEFSPIVWKADSSKTVRFCGCKHSKNGAFCDGTHKTL